MYHGLFESYKDQETQFVHKFYYGFISKKEKIQQAMEKRALQLILQKIVNEDFTWK